ncbi:MAG TPA: SRPBCC domain-containing protein [Candidatus Methylomirabilis sp.]|nr:SRPBCC domain-containing protein [Candidatus Methylomirabilis sp.]
MRVTREVAIAASATSLWALLWDVRRIVECLPGCVDAREVEPHRRYAARMEQRVGPISLSVPLDVKVMEAEEPHRLALDAKGKDPVIGAEVVARVVLDVASLGEESLLRIDAEGRILGRLGALGQGVIQRKAEEIIEEFGARLRRAAEAKQQQ